MIMKQSRPSPISSKAENRASRFTLQTSSLLRQGILSFTSAVVALFSIIRSQTPSLAVGRIASLCLLVNVVHLDRLYAAAPTPPNRMAFQSYLTDLNGDPVGTEAVAGGARKNKSINKNIIFTIWNDESANDTTANLIWSEEQIVTVNGGHFSVILGEGARKHGGDLSTVFVGNDASDRFIELTLVNNTANGGNQVLLPRLRLLPSPYAFIASNVASLNLSDESVIQGELAGKYISSGSITGNQIKNGAVTSSAIASNTIESSNIKDGSITSNDIANLTITASDIKDGAITSTAIASDTIKSSNIKDNTITQNDMGNGSVVNRESKKLRIVRGLAESYGTNYYGYSGWSVKRNGEGAYKITFNPPFKDKPAVTVTPHDYLSKTYDFSANVNSVEEGSVLVFTTRNGRLKDVAFHIIAIGAD